MTLKFVGACQGRTSTMSLKQGLAILGITKVYHMETVIFERPDDAPKWTQAMQLRNSGKRDECKEILKELCQGYEAMIDHPAAVFWEEFHELFPDIPVLLTVRDTPEKYGKSVAESVGALNFYMNGPYHYLPSFVIETIPRRVNTMIDVMGKESMYQYIEDELDGNGENFDENTLFIDREAIGKLYSIYVNKVRDRIPGNQLFELNAKQGWGPLVKMLGVKAPTKAYPHANDTEGMKQFLKLNQFLDTSVYAALGLAGYLLWVSEVGSRPGILLGLTCFLGGMRALGCLLTGEWRKGMTKVKDD